MDIAFLEKALTYMKNPTATVALGGPHFGLPHRVGSKAQRKLAAKLRKQKVRALIDATIDTSGGPRKNGSR
jgi:hypothetical protein